MLTVINANKQFGLSPVLSGVNLNVDPHQIVGLAGPSGSGKSTLLRCIQKLETLDSGSICFEGTSGFMFQDFQLFPHMTVIQNLMYAPKLHRKEVNHEEKARDLLIQLGIADKASSFPQQLSGGQKQRVALARSLMMQPSLLLCDEPTSGLDLATIDDVIILLNSVKAMGVTMLIASHDLNFLTQIANRVVVLKDGRIVAESNPLHSIKDVLEQKNHKD